MYITSQILVFIGLIIDLVGRCLKSKKQVLLFNTIASIFHVSSYLFLQSWLGAIANGINLVRNVCYVNFDKKNASYHIYLITIVLSILVFSISLTFLWTSALDLFLLASVIITTVGFSFKNVILTRISIMTNSSLWTVYNLSIKGYVNMACNLVGIIIALGSLIIYNIIPKIKKNKNKSEQKDEIIRDEEKI